MDEDVIESVQPPTLLSFEDDYGALGHMTGAISMDPTTSQFTLCGTPVSWLDEEHIVFGQVTH